MGKSTLVKKLLTSEFESNYIPTLNVKIYPWNNYIIWDTVWNKTRENLKDNHYFNAQLAIIMVDATSKFTSESVKFWCKILKRDVPDVKIGIFINKCDCEIKPETVIIAEKFASENNIPVIKYSLKNSFSANSFRGFLLAIART